MDAFLKGLLLLGFLAVIGLFGSKILVFLLEFVTNLQ